MMEFDGLREQVNRLHSQSDRRQVGGDHYSKLKIQPWDACEEWSTPEEFRGHLRLSAIQYLARCNDKGGLDDIKKAKHYLEKLIEVWA